MDKPALYGTRSRSTRAGVSFSAYLLLLLFAMALFWPLCMGRTLYWGDIVLYFAPMWRWEQQGLQHGHIPLWNSQVLGGQPFVGNPQEGVFYPATILLPFVPVWLYLSVLTVTHVFLCGAFMARYLSRWTRHPMAPVAGGLVYMGSECLIGRVQFPPMIFTAPFFPLLLCSLDGCFDADKLDADREFDLASTINANKAKKWRFSCHSCPYGLCLRMRLASRLKLALVVGLLVLAAHPQMAYLILACGSVYAFARYASQYRFHPPIPLRHALTVPIAGLLGLMLTAAQTLPAVQLLIASPREQLTPAQANRFVLEPINLLTLLMPRLRGNPPTADFWGGGNAWEPALFIGWLPLLLIGLACKDSWRRKRTRFWVIGAALGIWLSFGSVGGLYWLAFKTVPGLSNFHDPARFLIYTTFAFAFLSGIGWDALHVRIRAARFHSVLPYSQRILSAKNIANSAFLLALLLIATPLWFYGVQWNPTVSRSFWQRRPTYLPTHITEQDAEQNIGINSDRISSDTTVLVNRVVNGRVYLPAHDTLWKHYITDGYSDYGPGDDPHLQGFLDTLLPNIGMADGLRSASGYEPVPVAAPAALDGLGRLALKRGEPNFSRLMALMGANQLLLPVSNQVADARLVPQSLVPKSTQRNGKTREDKIRLAVAAWRNVDALPPAWIVYSTKRVEGKTRIVSALAAPDFQPDKVAIVSDPPQSEEPDLEWIEGKNIEGRDIEGRDIEGKQTSCRLRKINADTTDQEYEADSGDLSGMLIVSQAAYPGWKTTVDGKPAPLHRVDGALIGVYLPPGLHIVHITYRPDTYRFGLFLTLCASSIFCAGVGMWFAMRPLSNPSLRKQLAQSVAQSE